MSDLPPGTLYVRFSRDSDGDYRYTIYQVSRFSDWGDDEEASGHTVRWLPGAEKRCVRRAKRRIRKLVEEAERARKSSEMQQLRFVYDPRHDRLTRDFTEIEAALDIR